MSNYYTIDAEKLTKVTEIVNAEIDPAATEELVEAHICADWHEGGEHQAWIDNASPQEIADWMSSWYEESA